MGRSVPLGSAMLGSKKLHYRPGVKLMDLSSGVQRPGAHKNQALPVGASTWYSSPDMNLRGVSPTVLSAEK